MEGNMKPLVSIVILSWNRKNDLKFTLEKVFALDYQNTEVIVVDNHSTDGSCEMVAANFRNVRLIRLSRNVGIEGLNIGISNSCGKYIVLLDDDSHTERDAISLMVNEFERNERLAVAAFKIINYYSKKIDWPGTEDIRKDNRATVFIGCGVGFRKEVIDRINYFDSRYFLYLNELYLTARVIDLGYQVKYFPELVAYHCLSSKHRTNVRKIYYGTRNTYWFIWNHYPLGNILHFTIIWFSNMFIYYSLKRKGKELNAYLKGFFDALLGFRKILKDRKVLDPSTINYIQPYLERWYL